MYIPLEVRPEHERIGRLSNPSKMPFYAWGIPVSHCNTGGKLRSVPGSVCFYCSVDGRGRYGCPNVKDANERRARAMSSPTFVGDFTTVLNTLHERYGHDAHRWMDSGDITPNLLGDICAIASQNKSIRHWVPTKEFKLAKQAKNSLPSNVTLRVSAPMIDGRPLDLGLPTSTVHDKMAPIDFECPAHLQDNKCGDCRACWEYPGNISYKARFVPTPPPLARIEGV